MLLAAGTCTAPNPQQTLSKGTGSPLALCQPQLPISSHPPTPPYADCFSPLSQVKSSCQSHQFLAVLVNKSTANMLKKHSNTKPWNSKTRPGCQSEKPKQNTAARILF